MHQTYLDNWDQLCVAAFRIAKSLMHKPSLEQLALREAFERHGVIRSPFMLLIHIRIIEPTTFVLAKVPHVRKALIPPGDILLC